MEVEFSSQQFDEVHGEVVGIEEQELVNFLKAWNQELSSQEFEELQKNVGSQTAFWAFPKRQLPLSLISFYRFCNSTCTFVNGEREFSLFTTKELREMNLAYALPVYLAGGVSIGMDGAGNHIVLDMRILPENVEYKVYAVHSSDLEWDEAVLLDKGFVSFLRGRESIDL